jgi:aminoglycoside phosphotransferase (APT) family kinase protein
MAGVTRPAWHTAPDAAARVWVERCVGPGARLVRVRRLGGGIAMATDAVWVRRPDGEVAEVVLRRWLRPGWRDEEPELTPEHEAAILGLVGRSPVPVPRVLAVDADGEACGAPALLLERMPGTTTRWGRPPSRTAIEALGTMLAAIHRVDGGLRSVAVPFAPFAVMDRVGPPPASHRPELWRRAIETVGGDPPAGPSAFLHRDFHPGNVLWRGSRLSAVLDWTLASWGPPAADLGHLLVNLGADWTPAVADAAREAFARAGGDLTGGAWWDVRMTLDWLGDLAPEHGTGDGLERLETYLAASLDALDRR